MSKDDIITNRRALRNFHIIERYEAGISLQGSEVKSIRLGLANLQSSFARLEGREIILHGMDIQPYDKASHEQHPSRRPRKLLLHRREIRKLFELTSVKGNSLIPLRLYWKHGKIKVELGVGKGKDARDKREDLKKKTASREIERMVRGFNRRRG